MCLLLYVQNITTTQMPPKQFPISHVSHRDLWHGPLFSVQTTRIYLRTISRRHFSHFTFAFACRDESSRSVCNHLESLISITGAPKIVKSDNSLSLLRSKAVSQLLERYGVEHQSLSMSYAPRHNAVVERSVRVMRQLLKSETFGSHESWPKLLRKVCLVRNTIPRVYPSGTFASPYELFFNRKPPTPLVSPDHLLNNFAFLNKSQGEVDNLRRLILKDLTKLKKTVLGIP